LLLNDQSISHISTGAPPIRRRSPPVHGDPRRRLEHPQAKPLVPGDSPSSPMSPRISPSTTGALVGSPTPNPRRQ
jgi:hypothetical protein